MANTISDLMITDKPMLTPEDISSVLGSDPQTIRIAAKQNPKALGFPVCVIGNRVKIPRAPFLEFIGAK